MIHQDGQAPAETHCSVEAKKRSNKPPEPGQLRIFIHGRGVAKSQSHTPKGSVQESLLEFLLRLVDLV